MMTPEHPTHPISRGGGRLRSTLAVALLALTVFAVFSVARPADAADDVDLLRENGGNPFVMILLDTSASMGLAPPQSSDDKRYLGDLAAANGDDPASKLFQVKQALYEVFSQVENVSFGFAEYNTDHARVLRKHWFYLPTESASHLDMAGVNTLTYPVATTASPSDPRNTANRDRLETGWVFGLSPSGISPGTCDAPLVFDTSDKVNSDIRLNRFPKNVAAGPVRHWIEVDGLTYALDIDMASEDRLGDPQIDLQVALSDAVLDCTVDVPAGTPQTVTFDLYTDFLLVEADTTANPQKGKPDPGIDSGRAVIANDGYLASNCKDRETIAGFWGFQDIAADGTCGAEETRPFTGRGTEMNTDSGARDGHPDLDRFCWPNDSSSTCYNLRFPTALHPTFPELDFGDFIPMDWEADHREEFLKRLNPRHPDAPAENESDPDVLREYFGIAHFFEDDADPTAGILRLRDDDQKPIMAFGNSPLARAISDFRCWYNRSGSNKCKAQNFTDGFEKLFLENDSAFKCRIPYLITITDGEENTGGGEDSAADFNDLDGKYGIRNWIFSFQDHPDFQPIKSNANAEVILVTDQDDLKTKLREVIGVITQATRTFATAAVPSVQASVESRIYLTKFQPLNDAGIWEGHMHAFRLPMPAREDVPNSAYPNHIWDAASAILTQAPDRPGDGNLAGVTDLQLGAGANQRRVFWAQDKLPDSLGRPPSPASMNLFNLSSELGSPLEQELWKALDLSFDLKDNDTVNRARARADNIVRTTLVEKESPLVSDTDDLDFYILGDVFHSNPLVLGGPVNTRYFVEDAEETFNASGVAQGTGYREFFNRHENRRKVLLAGANDGQLHAFEAGVPGIHTETLDDTTTVTSVRFTEGTGRELFSFIPDEAMATVKLAAENPQTHRWGVDGSPAAGDVFIDPVHTGAPTAAEREWRTVAVTGMREGGAGYFALDMTYPDPLVTATIGRNNEPVAQRDVSLIQGFQESSGGPTPPGEAPDPGLSEDPTDTALIVPGCYANPSGCDGLQYPRMLWEFRDRVWDPTNLTWVALDEDGNGFADLGETWSTPDIGRIRVQSGGAIVNKYVSVFGGGLDPAKADSRGNWIYIVDMETGQAIYKRQLEGSAPSDPAAVDTDQDGFFDRIYIGTTAGKLYRIDLAAVDSLGNVVYPVLESQKVGGVRGLDGITYTTTAPPRIEDGTDAEPLWDPRLIFDTSSVVDGDTVARPIYYPPSVLFLADLGEFALALGTGDRDDLTSRDGTSGRFYVFVDETDQIADADLPMTESDLEQIDRDEGANDNLLTDPTLPVGQKGWFLVLSDKERLIGDPFGFSGVTFFATFEAEVNASCSVTCPSDLPEGETCTKCKKPNKDGVLSPDETPQCTIGGLSRIYVVGTTDADAFLTFDGTLSRSYEIPGQFVTSPFTEQAVTRTITTEEGEVVEADPLDEQEIENMKKLMELFPDRCKFGNHRIDVKVIRADSEIERIAAVPICIVEKNWKELGE